MTVHNQGTVQVTAGTLELGGNGGTHTGSFNATAGTLDFSGGTHNFDPRSSVTVAAGATLATSGSAPW